MILEDYARQFATASVRRLVLTIDRPEENDPLAVQAALLELERRRLPEVDVAAIRAELAAERDRSAAQKAKVERAGRYAREAVTEARNTFIVHPEAPKQEIRQVRILLVVIAVALCAVLPRYVELPHVFASRMDRSIVEYVLPLLLLPAALALLWERHRAGWFLGAAFTTFGLVKCIASAWFYWGREPMEFEMLERLFPTPATPELVFGALFALGMALSFQVRRSLAVFRITERERWITVAVAVVLAAWMWM